MHILSTNIVDKRANGPGGRGVKWELDLWYEMWDRAGSQGLDNWYPLPENAERKSEPDPEGVGGAPPVEPGGHTE
jgi:hypothetical protein